MDRVESTFGNVAIETDGLDDCPAFRAQLLAFIEMYCREMTLAQARDWLNTP